MGRKKRRILAERRGMLEAQAALKAEIQTAQSAAHEAQEIAQQLRVALDAEKAKTTIVTATAKTKTKTAKRTTKKK